MGATHVARNRVNIIHISNHRIYVRFFAKLNVNDQRNAENEKFG